MTQWIQVLNKEWLQVDVINKDLSVSNKIIWYKKIVEIADNCLAWLRYHKPNSYRIVNNPIRFYETIIFKVITWILIFFLWVFQEDIRLLILELFS